MGLIDEILDELDFIEDAEDIGINKKDSLVKNENAVKTANAEEEMRKKALECIYEKSYECPVCYTNFKNPTIRNGKARIKDIDMDLKPIYENLHAEYYDIVMCEKCGYSALTSKFSVVLDFQADLIKKQITPSFEKRKFNELYTSDDALFRYKQALQCSIVKRAKASEIAYTALKMAWIYRDLKDDIFEIKYIKIAYDGFNKAIQNKYYPLCGLGETTVLYILSNLAYRLGNKDRAKKILGGIIGKRDIQLNIKRKIEDFRELLKSD